MQCDRKDTIHFGWNELKKYKKKRALVHFIRSLDIKEEGETIILCTLEGNVEVKASKDIIVMIGQHEDIYPITREMFENKYQVLDKRENSELEDICRKHGIDVAKVQGCILMKDSFVYGRKMEEAFSVYIKHCNSLISGEAGDYYVVSAEDLEDIYIIDAEIMEETYELVED